MIRWLALSFGSPGRACPNSKSGRSLKTYMARVHTAQDDIFVNNFIDCLKVERKQQVAGVKIKGARGQPDFSYLPDNKIMRSTLPYS